MSHTHYPKYLIPLLSAFAIMSALPALAAEWVPTPSGTAANFEGIGFSSNNQTGLIVGAGGRVLRSTDGGKSWTSQTVGSTAITHNAVSFAPATQTAWMVSSDGRIRKTVDGGANWTEQLNIAENILGVYAIDADWAWAVGVNKVLRTTDGGANWEQRTETGIWNDVAFVGGRDVGYIVGAAGTILRTANGNNATLAGVTFATSTLTTNTLYGVAIVGNDLVFAVGENQTVLRWNGTSWSQVAITSVSGTPDFLDIHMPFGSSNGLIAAQNGHIYQTTDQGQTWQNLGQFFLPTPEDWNGAWMISQNNRLVVGNNGRIAHFDAIPPAAPANLALAGGGTFTNDTTPSFTWATSTDAETGIKEYRFAITGASTFNATVSSSTTSITASALAQGSHTASVRAVDLANNESAATNLVFTVNTAGPAVGTISPTTATVGTAVTFTAAVSGASPVTSCNLFVNGVNQGAMTVSGGLASRSHTFTSAGSFTVQARCTDAAGNEGVSPVTSVTASIAGNPVPGSLLKLACPSGAGVNHPCKAVYYFGNDGRRHAFPNEKAYFTWYTNFSNIVIVSDTFMASLPLGKNVVYRPGVKMVKFQTLARVYAVSQGGLLRWVSSESIAAALYGSTWNQKIDDISDAFFPDYSFGSDINSSGDYNPAAEMNAVQTINQNL